MMTLRRQGLGGAASIAVHGILLAWVVEPEPGPEPPLEPIEVAYIELPDGAEALGGDSAGGPDEPEATEPEPEATEPEPDAEPDEPEPAASDEPESNAESNNAESNNAESNNAESNNAESNNPQPEPDAEPEPSAADESNADEPSADAEPSADPMRSTAAGPGPNTSPVIPLAAGDTFGGPQPAAAPTQRSSTPRDPGGGWARDGDAIDSRAAYVARIVRIMQSEIDRDPVAGISETDTIELELQVLPNGRLGRLSEGRFGFAEVLSSSVGILRTHQILKRIKRASLRFPALPADIAHHSVLVPVKFRFVPT